MEKSDLVRETLGDGVFDFFLRNKRAEWDDYRRTVTPVRARPLPSRAVASRCLVTWRAYRGRRGDRILRRGRPVRPGTSPVRRSSGAYQLPAGRHGADGLRGRCRAPSRSPSSSTCPARLLDAVGDGCLARSRAGDPHPARRADPSVLPALRQDELLRRRLCAVLGASAALGDLLSAPPGGLADLLGSRRSSCLARVRSPADADSLRLAHRRGLLAIAARDLTGELRLERSPKSSPISPAPRSRRRWTRPGRRCRRMPRTSGSPSSAWANAVRAS